MSGEQKDPSDKLVSQWGKLKSSLDTLDQLYTSGKKQENFEYKLISIAKENQLGSEELRSIFNEYHIEKRKLKSLDDWFNKTPFFSLLQRFSTIIGVLTLVISAITFLPTQQQQRRTETERKNIEKDRSHYEAWAIINNNRVDIKGNLIKASSGKNIALQNLNRDRVPLQSIELPETFLLGIDLSGADLYRADFRGADLYRANFSSLPMQVNPSACGWWGWTKLVDCKSQEDIKERRTDLQRANFSGAILYGVNFNAPKSNGSEINKKLGVNLFRADFRPFYIRKFTSVEISDFLKSKDPLKQECIKNASSIECLLSVKCEMVRDPIIQCARPVNATFIGADLKAVDFTKANLKGSNFEDSDLECATFRGATFNQVTRLDSIDLPEGIPETNFKKANIKGADFRDVIDLSPAQIKQAVNWQDALYSSSFAASLGLSPQNKPFACKDQRYRQEPIRYPPLTMKISSE
jgi:uncharacterized protein YjbI with pentapeptide repeats